MTAHDYPMYGKAVIAVPVALAVIGGIFPILTGCDLDNLDGGDDGVDGAFLSFGAFSLAVGGGHVAYPNIFGFIDRVGGCAL